jgi:hypothetical protein
MAVTSGRKEIKWREQARCECLEREQKEKRERQMEVGGWGGGRNEVGRMMRKER